MLLWWHLSVAWIWWRSSCIIHRLHLWHTSTYRILSKCRMKNGERFSTNESFFQFQSLYESISEIDSLPDRNVVVHCVDDVAAVASSYDSSCSWVAVVADLGKLYRQRNHILKFHLYDQKLKMNDSALGSIWNEHQILCSRPLLWLQSQMKKKKHTRNLCNLQSQSNLPFWCCLSMRSLCLRLTHYTIYLEVYFIYCSIVTKFMTKR